MTQPGKRQLFFISLILAVVTIPLKNNWNSWAIVLFCLAAAAQQPLRESIARLKKDHYWKLSALFFLWLTATWFWDASGGFTVKQVETNAALLFLPLVLAITPRLSSREIGWVCYGFIGVVLSVALFCLAKSGLEYLQSGDYRVFFYHYLGYQAGLNAVYLSNYCVASIAWLLYLHFINKDPRIFRLPPWAALGLSVFLFLFMFLLSAKMSLAIGMLVIVSLALYIGYRRKRLLWAALLLAGLGIVAFFLVRNLHYLNWRISSTEWKAYSGEQDNNNGLALRLTTWGAAVHLIRERPVQGYGLRGANEKLVERYHEINFPPGIPERYNSHNQFLETTLKAGLVGLALLLLLLGLPLARAFRQKRGLLGLIVLHFCLVSLTEATMEIQQELIFYWFFIFFFYYHYFSGQTVSLPRRHRETES